MELLIYGAQPLALGACEALRLLYPAYRIRFLVTSMTGNRTLLAGLPVWEIKDFTENICATGREDYHVLVATPEDLHADIVDTLIAYGYTQYTCLNSVKGAELMERYFKQQERLPSIHDLELGGERAELCVYMAQFCKDRSLKNPVTLPAWTHPLQVGAALTKMRIAADTDDTGANISAKNVNYCELTALYWMWKNKLGPVQGDAEYYGLYHTTAGCCTLQRRTCTD